MKLSPQPVAAGAVGALLALVLIAAGPMTIRADGLEFPDGTLQTTAAGANLEAWPYACDATVFSGNTDFLYCESMLAGGPPAIDENAGVPSGYYLVITDAILRGGSYPPSDPAIVDVRQRSGCEGGSASPGYSRSIALVTNASTSVASGSPLLVLGTLGCLEAHVVATGPTAVLRLRGYLTQDPTHFRW